MIARRHGRRIVLVLAPLLMATGCGTDPPAPGRRPPLARIPGPSAGARSDYGPARQLDRPDGQIEAVAGLAWGGPIGSRRLGVLFADGRFAIYRPEASTRPVAVAPSAIERRARVMAIVAADRAVTGDERGLTLWGLDATARELDRDDCGAVDALALSPEGDLLAGLDDGRIVRLPAPRGDQFPQPMAERKAKGAVVGLAVAGQDREVLIRRGDGQAERLRRDLGGTPRALGPALAIAAAPASGRLARLVAGTTLEVEDAGRLRMPEPVRGLDWLASGPALIVTGRHAAYLVNLPERGPIAGAEIRVVRGDEPPPKIKGGWIVAADPEDRTGGRLALADPAGRIEVIAGMRLRERSPRLSLDELPDLAFRPDRRFYRPRPGTRGLELPEGLERRIEAGRVRLDRGAGAELLGTLRELDDDPALSRLGAAEVRTLTAAAEQAAGWPISEILKTLERAATLFERQGRGDREADIGLWRGILLASAPGGEPAEPDPRRAEDALDQLRRAADRYRAAGPALERQALLCEAIRARALLDLNDLRGAALAFRPVEEASAHDPVLKQVIELDRISACLAAARGHWPAAADADGRLLDRLGPKERPGLRREAALARLGALAALGRWNEAARRLEPEPADDLEWRLRRLTCRRRAGLDVAFPKAASEDDHHDAHLRGRLLASDPDRLDDARAELEQAAEDHRQAGRADLALEADLERAETLERLGRHAEAAPLYAAVARQLRAGLGTDRARRSARPIRSTIGRPYRGLARCRIALGQPAHALGALDAADLARWLDRMGEGAVRSAGLGIPPNEAAALADLRATRHALELDGGPGGGPESATLMAKIRRLESTLSAHHRALAIDDPMAAFDPSPLRLAEDEAVLVFTVAGPDSIVGFFLRGSAPPEVQRLPTTRTELRRAVRSWRSALGDGGRGLEIAEPPGLDGLIGLAPEPDLPAPSNRPPAASGRWEEFLDDTLIRPFEAGLSGVSRLTIIPTDALAALPFEAIGHGRRLLQRFRISYAPSLAMLLQARDDRRGEPEAASNSLMLAASGTGRGPSAPWARADALADPAATLRREGKTASLVAGAAARPERLLESASERRFVLEFSGLGTLDPARSPWADVDLRMATGGRPPRGDGRLTAGDLIRTPLQARALVLAVGDPAGPTGPGLRDLAGAALATGADAVVLSLWEPPAATGPRWLAEFHRQVADGQAPAQALDAARLAIARQSATRDPVHWASFVLYGDRPPMTPKLRAVTP